MVGGTLKIVFIDTEYTGEHALTTLVSVDLVTLEGNGLCLALNDYDRDQVTKRTSKIDDD